MDGVTLLSAIGSVASIASLIDSYVLGMRGLQSRSLDGTTPRAMASIPPTSIVRAAQAMSRGDAEREAAEILKNSSIDLIELQELADKLKSEVCAILRHIKQFNAGKLPGRPLVEKWVKFQCV